MAKAPTSNLNSQMILWSKASLPSQTTFERVPEKNKTKSLFHPSHSLPASLSDGEELCPVLRDVSLGPSIYVRTEISCAMASIPTDFYRCLSCFLFPVTAKKQQGWFSQGGL